MEHRWHINRGGNPFFDKLYNSVGKVVNIDGENVLVKEVYLHHWQDNIYVFIVETE